MSNPPAEKEILRRRVAGWHDVRLDGMTDLVLRAPGASVMDIGCNRGMLGHEFACNGAALVHGCDWFPEGIATARQVFADSRHVKARFEVVDLRGGAEAMQAAFGDDYQEQYDIMLYIATHHKLLRQMKPGALRDLVQHLGSRTRKFFAWSGVAEAVHDMEGWLAEVGLRRIHKSEFGAVTVGAAGYILARR